MIKNGSLPLVLAVCLALFGGCSMFHREGGNSPIIIGTWTNAIGTTWEFKEDGTFDADLNRNGKRDAWGTYKISGNQITLQRTGGLRLKGCDGKGVYQFERDADRLKFTLVRDACKLRQKNVLMEWRAKR